MVSGQLNTRNVAANEVDAILATIDTTPQDQAVLPGISNFRFWVQSRKTENYDSEGNKVLGTNADILIIDVLRWIRGTPVRGSPEVKYRLQKLGRFEMRGTHMVALKKAPMESANMPATTPTYFN
ncbi:hypothetical protein ACHAQK_012314 [Fusarium lateritium]